ncbi:MAG: hypothetical protein AAGI37_00675 [Planctomycetota bacterium]
MLFAQAPVVLEEDFLGLEIAVEPALDDVDVLGDEGVLPLLLFLGGHLFPRADVFVSGVRFNRGERSQADHAVPGLFLCQSAWF